MTPYLGKGATSAIFDALTLAKYLKLTSSHSPESISSALHAYEAIMLKAGFAMQEKSKKVHDLVFMGSSKSKAKWRNRMLKALDLLIGDKYPKSQPFPGK